VAFVMMPKRPKYVGGLIIVLLVAARLTGPQLLARYGTAFASSEDRDGSSQSRLDLWKDCLTIVEKYPVFGVGPANWRTIAASFGWPPGKSAHSVWMESAAELGAPGALFLFLFFAAAAWQMWPLARARLTDENRYEIAVATGVVLSIVGFVVSGQFVSAPALEVPYYVTMLGVALLKSNGLRESATTTDSAPAYEETPYGALQPSAALSRRSSLTGANWTPQSRA
jgi:O-antigen ligase